MITLRMFLYKIKKRIFPRGQVDIISYPKSGRTWTSFMIGTYLIKKYKLEEKNHNIIHELKSISDILEFLPKLKIHHDGRVHYQRPDQIISDKTKYKKSKVIFLVRDPRDVVVSMYFENSKRIPQRKNYLEDERPFAGSIKEFLYHEQGSLATIVKFMNVWYEQRLNVKSFEIIKYEDLKRDTFKYLRDILFFIGETNCDEVLLGETIEKGSFDSMRKMEQNGVMGGYGLRPGDKNDTESYKTRRGKIGGYKDYFAVQEVNFMNDYIKKNLNPNYGY